MASELVRRAYKRTFHTTTESSPLDPREHGLYRSVAETTDFDAIAFNQRIAPISNERDPLMRSELLHLQFGSYTHDNTEHFLYTSYTGARVEPEHAKRRHKSSNAALQFDDATLAQRNVAVLAGKLEMDNFPTEGASKPLDRDIERNTLILLARLLTRRRNPLTTVELERFAINTAIQAVSLTRKQYLETGTLPANPILASVETQPNAVPSVDRARDEFQDALQVLVSERSDLDTAQDNAKRTKNDLYTTADAVKRSGQTSATIDARLKSATVKIQSVTASLDYAQRTRRSDATGIQELRQQLNDAIEDGKKLADEQKAANLDLESAKEKNKNAATLALAAQTELANARAKHNATLLFNAGPKALSLIVASETLSDANVDEARVGDAVALIAQAELNASIFNRRNEASSAARKQQAESAARQIEALRRSIPTARRSVLQQLAGSAVLPFALSNDFVLYLESADYLTIV